MPKFPNWLVGSDVSATNLANTVPNIITKAAVTTITSNIVLANDAELQNIALEVGTWEIDALFIVLGATGGNVRTAWAFTGTTTGTPNRSCLGPASASTAAPGALVSIGMQTHTYTTAITYGTNSAALPFHFIKEECTSFVVATTGNFSVQFSQSISFATSTVIQPGSRVKCRRIA